MKLITETNQATFNTVVEHLASMPGQCAFPLGELGNCLYWLSLPDGTTNRCAIGALVTEDDAQRLVEYGGPSVDDLVRDGELVTNGVDPALLSHLQQVHDTERNWDGTFTGWDDLREVASHFDLDASRVPR